MSKITRREVMSNAGKAVLGAVLLGNELGTGGGDVIPPPDSHIPRNELGLHWLRCSFHINKLSLVEGYISQVFGTFDKDSFGLWSFTDRFSWPCGVTINYDSDPERSKYVHKNKAVLECTGKALDGLGALDLQTLIEFLSEIGARCLRLDIFFDDYKRIVEPTSLQGPIKCNDYSGFDDAGFTNWYHGGKKKYDIAMFGARGGTSSKYLRVYDKNLESDGEKDCVRWEVEFTKGRAHKAFMKIAETCANLDAFALICGSLIAGCISFVHRTGDKNVKRLKRYRWWGTIQNILGGRIEIRLKKNPETLKHKITWLKHGVSPSLACVRHVFVTDGDFFLWLEDMLSAGEKNMNAASIEIVADYDKAFAYYPEARRMSYRVINGVRVFYDDVS